MRKQVVFNNNKKGKGKKQLESFVKMVEKMVETNGKSFYTDDMFTEAEEVMQKQIEQKIEDEIMPVYEARKSVRKDVEEEGSMLSVIGKTIFALVKDMITTTVEATGVPRLLNGLAGLFGK